MVGIELVVDAAIRRHEHAHARRIKHVQAAHHADVRVQAAPIIPFFQDIRVAVDQLGLTPNLQRIGCESASGWACAGPARTGELRSTSRQIPSAPCSTSRMRSLETSDAIRLTQANTVE